MRKTKMALTLTLTLTFACTVWLAGCVSAADSTPQPQQQVQTTPSIGELYTRLSEQGGYFDSDNLISNESSYLHALDELRERGVKGGAYVGVGPDQSFS